MKKMNFDITDNESPITYGYMIGNENVLVIKAGKGGEYHGYDNKYLQIASKLNEKCGYTVICISNPLDDISDISDEQIISSVVMKLNIKEPKLYFMGASDGAVKGLELMAGGIGLKRLLLINMPLMINFYKKVKYISDCPISEIRFVYGDRDPSFSYIPFLKLKNLSNVEIVTVPDADHNFTGKVDEFIDVAVDFFSLTA